MQYEISVEFIIKKRIQIKVKDEYELDEYIENLENISSLDEFNELDAPIEDEMVGEVEYYEIEE